MSSPRLLLASHEFWPVAGETSWLATALAEQLQQLGVAVTVLTSQMVRQWPEFFELGEIRVHRLSTGGRIAWPGRMSLRRMDNWLRSVGRWCAAHPDSADVALCFDSRTATAGGLRQFVRANLPTMIRVVPSQIPHWKRLQPFPEDATVCRLVVTESKMQGELLAGHQAEQVVYVADGVPDDFQELTKTEARKALALTHEIFDLPASAMLAVNTQAIEQPKDFGNLVSQWRLVTASVPHARLWLMGHGSAERAVYQMISDYDLRDSVIMPGQFESIDGVMQAADLFISDSNKTEFSTYLKLAISLGIPIVCRADSPAGEHFQHATSALLTGASTNQSGEQEPTRSIAKLVIECCRNPDWAAKLGQTARSQYRGQFAMDRMAAQYLEIIQGMLGQG